MREPPADARFEQTLKPHLDAAYNLARWLTKNPDDAQDVVQEALIRALKFFSGYRGGDARAWFLAIVRNACFSWLQRRQDRPQVSLEDSLHEPAAEPQESPESSALHQASRAKVRQAIGELPLEFREAIILRELEGLSYKEISAVTGVPIGTVMSRLARARERLQAGLAELRSQP